MNETIKTFENELNDFLVKNNLTYLHYNQEDSFIKEITKCNIL